MIDKVIKECAESNILVQKNVQLKDYTTFKIGGPAKIFVRPNSIEQAVKCMHIFGNANVKPFILGNGSNVLFPDEGFEGAILYLGEVSSYIEVNEYENTIICDAGLKLSSVCLAAQQAGLQGIEFAYGIPGTIGGAVYMNAGAFGGEMKDIVASVEYINENGIIQSFSSEEIEWDYRYSIFQKIEGCIIRVKFSFTKGSKSKIRSKMDDISEKRTQKQPLNVPSAGSTFKRPKDAYAAALIESCGLKGKRIGGAAVSEKHAGFVVNLGDATAKDVCELIEHIKTTIKKQTGILLETEVNIIT